MRKAKELYGKMMSFFRNYRSRSRILQDMEKRIEGIYIYCFVNTIMLVLLVILTIAHLSQ